MSYHFRTGRGGKKVKIPHGYTSREGRDGRVVAVPPGGTSREGSDGRVAAIKRGARLTKVGTDGLWGYQGVTLPRKEVMDEW